MKSYSVADSYLVAHKADLIMANELCHRAWSFAYHGDLVQAEIYRNLMDAIYIRLEEGYLKWKVTHDHARNR